jgi:hypothetical protein
MVSMKKHGYHSPGAFHKDDKAGSGQTLGDFGPIWLIAARRSRRQLSGDYPKLLNMRHFRA